MRATALAPVLRLFVGAARGPARNPAGRAADALRDPCEESPLAACLRIFAAAARAAHDPVLGARLGRSISPADLGPAGLPLAQSVTLRLGITRFQGALAALQNATEMIFTRDAEEGGWPAFRCQTRGATKTSGGRRWTTCSMSQRRSAWRRADCSAVRRQHPWDI